MGSLHRDAVTVAEGTMEEVVRVVAIVAPLAIVSQVVEE